MADIQQDIRNWLHRQHDWLQKGAEMLMSSGVSETGIRELSDLLKTPEGQNVTSHRTFGMLARESSLSDEIRLLAIGDVSGIENLEPREPLRFGAGNLSVIYGNNGSGKSGYTRLLKKACGDLRAKEIEPNVFKLPPSASKCTICYQVAGKDMPPAEWRTDDKPIDVLRAVDIFDDDAAKGYLTEETGAAYTPPFVGFFEDLAKVCVRITAQLQAEQNKLVSALPTIPPEYAKTEAGVAYHALKHEGNKISIQKFTRWRDEDKRELAQLTERLKVTDPAALAREKRKTKQQVDEITNTLRKAATALGSEKVSVIRALRAGAKEKRKIATEAAPVSSAKADSAKLDGIGTNTWMQLWDAARAYSQIAYPGEVFPFTNDSRCVLCHQYLKEDAQQRLKNFETYVQGTLESEAETAEKAYKQALAELPMPMTSNAILTQSRAANLTEEHWVGTLGAFWGQVHNVRDALLNDEVPAQITPIVSPNHILDELKARSASLDGDATQYDKDAQGFNRAQAKERKLNLEAQQWTAQQVNAINREVKRRQQMEEYERWKHIANSRSVSVEAGKIAERVITDAFVSRFNNELKKLGAARISVQLLKTRTERGKVFHKVQLKNAKTHKPPHSVLSEGERRVVGLAAFLANVTAQPHAAPFVFDDPISSLDNDFELCVARRLAELAQDRQVIIFTHRLSLYGAMEEMAKKFNRAGISLHLQQHCIEMSPDGVAGHPVDQEVWNANTKKANNILLDKLSNAKKNESAYKAILQEICSEFRNLLERTVESDLLNEVVMRHHRNITTNNTLWALTHISRDDCKFIDDLMSKYSVYAHSQSLEAPNPPPEESDLREDLQSLKEWREKFKERRKKNNN